MSERFSMGKLLLAMLSVIWMIVVQFTSLLEIVMPDICFFIVYGLLETGLIYAGIRILVEKGLKSSMEEFRIKKFYIKPVWILTAAGLPLCVCIAAILFLEGDFSLHELTGYQMMKTLVKSVFVIGIGTAVAEEFVFRGVVMTAVEKRWNVFTAVLLPSLSFGVLHIVGAGFSFWDSVVVVIAGSVVGIYFSVLTYMSGTIWFSVTAHAFWNVITTLISISEQPSDNALMSFRLKSNDLYSTGGMFGIDASILSILMYLVFTMAIMIAYYKRNGSIFHCQK